MQSIPADALRGKAVRLRGHARVTVPDTSGSGALWLRVDRPDRAMGFFDNMGNRPIREAQWREYAIEGSVAEDATNVAFGVMASGPATADFDGIELAVRESDGRWTPVQIADSGFEAADSGPGGWFRTGTSKTAAITRLSAEPPEGRQFLRLTASGTAPASTDELIEDAPPVAGTHVDVDLAPGLRARVPLVLSDAEASADTARSNALDALRQAIQKVPATSGEGDGDVRLADIVVAWNVFRHFYPYWTEAAVDWDARLRPLLEGASGAKTRPEHRIALRRLVADARDGHGGVYDTRQAVQQAALPIQLAAIGDRMVISATDAPADAPVGAVISSIDGVPATDRLSETMRLVSGTTQLKRSSALQEIARCAKGTVVALGLESDAGTRETKMKCDASRGPAETRPEAISELQPGIWYVDLTRAQMSQIKPALDQMARATAIVFDMRGYPRDAGAGILPHLIDAPEQDRWMHVAKIVGPFGQSAGWISAGWNLAPMPPRLRGRIVFMTDGRAISYAESVMGYIADRKLGTIVGATTAGTNGNVAAFEVPGGFRITFTGMRVTRHDGQGVHHLVGVKADVPIEPTLESIRQGRDAVLDRAVELAKTQ